jgi:hypothetical protein
MTVDPRAITQFSRTVPELEEFLLFAIVVAGKRSDLQSRKLDAFLRSGPRASSPFGVIRSLQRRGKLVEGIEAQRLGQYRRIGAAFACVASAGLDLRACSVADLEAIPGIGPKTARFFLLHSRPGVRVAALDTHILSWMRSQGFKTPAVTPQSAAAYGRLERQFLALADRAGVTVADFDLDIWKGRQTGAGVAKAPRRARRVVR